MKRRMGAGLAVLCGAALVSGGVSARVHDMASEAVVSATSQAQTPPKKQQPKQKGSTGQTGQMKDQPSMKPPPPDVAGKKSIVMTLVTSADRLASAPAALYGLPVSVHAKVGEVKGANAFTLDENAWFSGPDVLVLVPKPRSGATLNKSDYVTVVGRVRPFVRADLDKDYDWFDAVPDLDVEFESRPVIVADVVRTSDGTEVATDDGQVTRVLVASAGDIADLPGRFYGRSVSVHADVAEVKSQRLFTLDEDKLFAGPDVLVLNPFPAIAPRESDTATVIGIVRPLVVAEFERDYDWFNAADYTIELEQFERRPVVVAHSIILRGDRQIVQVVPGFTLDRSEEAVAGKQQGGTKR